MEFKTYEGNLEEIQSKLNTFNNKARRLDLPEISLEIKGSEMVIKKETAETKFLSLTPEYVKVLFLEIKGELPKLNNFEFIATIQHTNNGNIVRNISGTEIPERYRNSESYCEHCNSLRRRNDTYIVRNTITNEYKQVGRSCLKDFTRMSDIENRFHYYEDLLELREIISTDNSGGYGKKYTELKRYMALVVKQIRVNGWISRAIAEQWNKQSTSSEAAKYLTSIWCKTYTQHLEYLTNQPDEEDKEQALSVIAWVRSELKAKENKSEYEHNLSVAIENDYITGHEMGLVASAFIVKDYADKKAEEQRLKRAEFAKRKNEHIGEIGSRIELYLTLENTRAYSTEFGIKHILIMADEEGNTIIWKTTTGVNWEIGQKHYLKGTVKEHSEFGTRKQTVLTRCKLLV